MRNQLFLLFASLFTFSFAQNSTLTRNYDPLIITGAELPEFNSLQPGKIVGFKFSNDIWVQIPVQADERAVLDIISPYGTQSWINFSFTPSITFYCCANTFVGNDANILFDANDELVFMIKDAGGKADGSMPAGVVGGSCKEIQITDPLGGIGYVYLFESDGSLHPDAGASYVSMSSNVNTTSGFPVNFNFVNAENTSISTPFYSWHFSSEWVSDELKISSGGGVDILDRYKNFFVDGDCTRHEDSFSEGENAFVAIKSGPVRVIRSYMGAQSGPLTQRTHFFYENRHDIATDLRVHNISSIYDAFDYNSEANGMKYSNNLDTAGVIIDGQQDSAAQGEIQWEQVSGAQGTLVILHKRITNLSASDASFVAYYDDNAMSPASNCTGDGQAWGTSGIGIEFANGSVCTDPILGGCAGTQWLRHMQAQRILYTGDPQLSSSFAATLSQKMNHPLQVSFSACQVTSVKKADNNSLTAIKLFPNPSSGQISVETRLKGTISVFDIAGREILKSSTSGEKENYHITERGVYFLVFEDENGQRTTRLFAIQ